MKRYRISFSRIADVDLVAVHDYVYGELRNPMAARKIVEGIMIKCQKLGIMPKAGAVKLEINGIQLRFGHYRNFTIVHCIDENTREAIIRRIVYSGRNIEGSLRFLK